MRVITTLPIVFGIRGDGLGAAVNSIRSRRRVHANSWRRTIQAIARTPRMAKGPLNARAYCARLQSLGRSLVARPIDPSGCARPFFAATARLPVSGSGNNVSQGCQNYSLASARAASNRSPYLLAQSPSHEASNPRAGAASQDGASRFAFATTVILTGFVAASCVASQGAVQAREALSARAELFEPRACPDRGRAKLSRKQRGRAPIAVTSLDARTRHFHPIDSGGCLFARKCCLRGTSRRSIRFVVPVPPHSRIVAVRSAEPVRQPPRGSGLNSRKLFDESAFAST